MNKCVPVRVKLERRREIDPETGCWNWTGTVNNCGYAMFSYNRPDGSRTTTTAHRASYQEYVGEIAAGSKVCHRCDNPRCFNPNHLFLGTQADNIADMIAKGRANFGHGRRPLSRPMDIILKAANDNRPLRVVAEELGLTATTILRWRRQYKVA